MKKNNLYSIMAISIAFLLSAAACDAPGKDTATKVTETIKAEVVKPDLAKIKAEIQVLNNAWAVASNARDIPTILAFYAEDAISMSDDKPMFVGKAAIRKDSETWFAKRKAGTTVSYETLDVFGDENLVTEIGTARSNDASGKLIYSGKYMAIWEKRDRKWLTIRDISNDDAKDK
jgi:uncharacterized protein (TIGR02246 family)